MGAVADSWDIITGKDYNYKAVTDTPAHFAAWLGNSMVPFAIGQLPQGVKQFAGGVVTGNVGEITAGGVQVASQVVGVKSYPETDWHTNASKLGLPMYNDPALYSTENPIYDSKWYYSTTLGQVGNANPNEIIGNKDYPTKVQSIVEVSQLLKNQVDVIPTRTLTSLNTDSSKGDTYKELYQQWVERQKLINDPKALAAFDARYTSAKSGNMTQQQYVLLDQYNQMTDATTKQQFLVDHPELTQNAREEYLKAHPDENAKLALWGQAKLYSKDAYTKLIALQQELDIPDNALVNVPPKNAAEDYFKYLDLVDKYGSGDAEVKLLLVNNPDLSKYVGVTVDTTKYPVESLKISVQYRTQDETYSKLPNSKQKLAYLVENPAYATARYTRTAYDKGYSAAMIPEYAKYEIAINLKGISSKNYLAGHMALYKYMLGLGDIAAINFYSGYSGAGTRSMTFHT